LRISRQKAGQFLCGLDLLAERVGFSDAIYPKGCLVNEMPKTEVITASYVLSHLKQQSQKKR